MSYISWNSEHNEQVLVRGSERAHMSLLAENVGMIPFDMLQSHMDVLNRYIVAKTYDGKPRVFGSGGRDHYAFTDFKTSARVSDGVQVGLNGILYGVSELALTTALKVGGDPIALSAFLHGACESHAWVDDENREWLVEVIEEGRETGVFRPDMGWESLIELLKTGNPGPIVTAYSISDSFPTISLSDWKPSAPCTHYEEDEIDVDERCDYCYDAWYDLPLSERWTSNMAKRPKGGFYEISPGFDRYFGSRPEHNTTTFTVINDIWEDARSKGYFR